MYRAICLLLPLMVVAGCDRSPQNKTVSLPAGGAKTQLSADPIIKQMAGHWGHRGSDGRVVMTVAPDGRGGGILHVSDIGEGWWLEIKNARIRQGKILFDQYHHADNPAAGGINGVRCEVVFQIMPGRPNLAKLTLSPQGMQPQARMLTRIDE